MRLLKTIAAAFIGTCLAVTVAFSGPAAAAQQNDMAVEQGIGNKVEGRQGCDHCKDYQQDPIKALQAKKEKVQELLKEGKITKEKADALNAKIDSKIKEVEEFNKLTLQQKKDKLINDFKSFTEQKVKDGVLTGEKRDEIIKQFTEKIDKWDGNGYPMFHRKGSGNMKSQ